MAEFTLQQLKAEAKTFVEEFNVKPIPSLYGVSDGKRVGTFVERSFHDYIGEKFSTYIPGNAASGIDFPELGVDLKVTSLRQPQSSSPFRDATQKVYGLGYHLLVLVYRKVDDNDERVARLDVEKGIFVSKERSGDYQTTTRIKSILENNGNVDDLIALLEERNLPLDDIGRTALAERILEKPPEIGYLTVSNALQWRLQYGRVIALASRGELMVWRTYLTKDLGDFQTPPPLVEKVMRRLMADGRSWSRMLEPTCGEGNFIQGALNAPCPPSEVQGLEIQDSYIRKAIRKIEDFSPGYSVKQANIFDLDFRTLSWSTGSPLLVVGNPPWVTNSGLGALGSSNTPRKTNFKKLRGLEAMTGSSNFDLAEYIWLRLITELAGESPTIALLCKTSVARNVLRFASKAKLPIKSSSIRKIDAKKWFGVAVDACLFEVVVEIGKYEYKATVYDDLESAALATTIGMVDGELVSDVEKYQKIRAFDGKCPLVWRQGIKHDAASVLELSGNAGEQRNKLGELVQVEPEYAYPLLKSSDVFRGNVDEVSKTVLVTHRRLGESTAHLENSAPRLWEYLMRHSDVFEKRKSSIYRGKFLFAMFGVGDYTFADYKVAISGMHKEIRFRCAGTRNGKPVLFDDTCYFVPCESAEKAAFICSVLNDPLSLELMESLVFWDSKRPVTKRLLQRMDLKALFESMDRNEVLSRAKRELVKLGTASAAESNLTQRVEKFLEPDSELQNVDQLRLL